MSHEKPAIHWVTDHSPAAGEAMFAATRALCNLCGQLCDAKIVFDQGRVLLVKWCLEHGRSSALISSDVQWYVDSMAYIKPGTVPLHREVGEYKGCPDSCGLCSRHQQHTCMPILELTAACDMKCPICLVGDTPAQLTLDNAKRALDTLVRCEGQLNMLNVSGGEPTMHPDFLEIVRAAGRPEIGVISVSTNGLHLSQNEALLRELIERKVVISLQFDGVEDRTYQLLRGEDSMAAMKLRLIDQIEALGGRTSLTMTLARSVNEHEIPAVLDLLFERHSILSVMVQPLALAGRAAERVERDVLDAVTIPEVVDRLVAGSKGVLQRRDFSPLPCSHPSCFALTYLLKTEHRLVPLPSLLDAGNYLDIIKNEALFGTDMDSLIRIKDALYDIWSSDGVIPDRESVLKSIKGILLELNTLDCCAPHTELLDIGTRNIKSIFIHHFMDRATFDLTRVVKCCNHYPQADGRLLPACVRNNLGSVVL